MTLPSAHPGVNLAATIDNDDMLYRTAQALLALTSAPGRRNLRPARHDDRWVVYCMTASAMEFPPPTLSVHAGLRHRAHLHALLLAPLAVETPQFTTDTTSRTTYAVPRGGLPALFEAARVVAQALDAQEDAGQGTWWGRAARRLYAGQQVAAALHGLRDAGTQVNVILLQ